MSTKTDLRLHRMRVDLPGGRVLHIALVFEDGAPADLLITAGPESAGLRELLSEAVSVPAAALPVLRDALASLPSGSSQGDL